ncbi:Ribonuclease inhibitor [Seminavis robusta]|uniref:Ribonuclease inhibitor n=1 Tax=Seminavis robusta TaxID=568900 RepID=A0A9N8E6X1_9STRA|nr:Ribonuclease inhibitor [Seminavis robusta]|eukprot:Sro741_g195700.1 Ribonuclease inhibitor (370) ;mRNA; r:16923-18032
MVYVIGLSLVMAGAILPATTTNWMASAYHSIRPCRAMEQVLHQLEHESKLTGISYQQESRPLQAQGLSNGYLKRLARALETHFERFSRNESEQFKYIQDLNLIANIFDDRGVKHVLAALEHPHAYTTSLLLGRNTLIGDETALGLANLVASGGGNNQNLTWLALGGTAITRNGIGSLYKALGTRPFSLLGFDYTYRPSWSQRILPLRTNPIADSFPQLHQASLLKELSLTGNRLEDEEMLELTKSILQTNITMLGLTNNRLSPRGIRDLLPLTKHLQKLELSMNRGIGDEGAILLANALKSNDTTIETLTLVECDITQTGADAFRSIFPENTKLKHLLLSHKDNGRIRAETLQSIKEATAPNWDRSKRH